MVFNHFKWLKVIIIFYVILKLYEIQFLVSINKVLVETATLIYLCVVTQYNIFMYSYFHAVMAELSVMETSWPLRPKIFIIWPFTEKFAHLWFRW